MLNAFPSSFLQLILKMTLNPASPLYDVAHPPKNKTPKQDEAKHRFTSKGQTLQLLA